MTQATETSWSAPAHDASLARQRAWVEVNTGAISANARSLKRCIGNGTELMAVVKADGYGHGSIPVARAARLLWWWPLTSGIGLAPQVTP